MGFNAKHMDGVTDWHADEAVGLECRCGGMGIRNCECGGDLCVCGNNGEAECIGCPDCEGLEEDEVD